MNAHVDDNAMRTARLNFRSTAAYLGWFRRLAAFLRTSQSDAIDRALVGLAQSAGFPEPPPRR